MIPDDKDKFKKMLIELGSTYSKSIDRDLLNTYWKALSDLEVQDLQLAIDSHVQVGKFFPKPAELREYIVGENNGKGAQSMQWLMANIRF